MNKFYILVFISLVFSSKSFSAEERRPYGQLFQRNTTPELINKPFTQRLINGEDVKEVPLQHTNKQVISPNETKDGGTRTIKNSNDSSKLTYTQMYDANLQKEIDNANKLQEREHELVKEAAKNKENTPQIIVVQQAPEPTLMNAITAIPAMIIRGLLHF